MAKEHERAELTNRALARRPSASTPPKKSPRARARHARTSKKASAIRDFIAKLKKEGKVCAFCGGTCDRCPRGTT
jgi:hypothetical protein